MHYFFFLPGRNGEFVGSCVGNCVLSGLICSNSGGRSLGGSAVCRGTSTGGRTKNKTNKYMMYNTVNPFITKQVA